MASFAVIEVADGLTVVDVATGESAEEVALSEGGALIDPGPFRSYEKANDALDQLEEEGEEDRESARGVTTPEKKNHAWTT